MAGGSGTPPVYEVVLATPNGDAVLEVPTYQGAEAAARRAKWTAVHLGWGDVDQVKAVSAVRMHMPDGVSFVGPLT